MANKKNNWLWNILIVVTIIISILAFTAHYKNWTEIKPNSFRVLSGIYYEKFNFSEVDSVEFVERIPPMQRLNGFSAFEVGKGVYQEFKDSLTDKKALVFIDNFERRKIRLVKKDASQFFINLKDSVETDQLFLLFQSKLEGLNSTE
ncbi:hypothetical protein JQC67_04775 [Aurantibacter crassamenti]|uniref:hypothetical protein n=1 Tax=Aurantibacter crassamenti TaxID=1837375 RepID=UPI001939313E|nr:hypothetical protein [Aurantibacter crassamenti]MBM1105451.1 hypothetical protein [Aurantibacter crassamenti]